MSIEGIHPCKRLLASVAGVWSEVQVKSFVTLAIVLTGEALFASWPLAFEWPLLIVRPQVAYRRMLSGYVKGGGLTRVLTLQVEVPSKGAATSRNRAHKASFSLPPSLARLGGSGSGDLLSFNSGPWVSFSAIRFREAFLSVRRATIRARIW